MERIHIQWKEKKTEMTIRSQFFDVSGISLPQDWTALPLFVEFAGKQVRIVIKSKPGASSLSDLQPLFLHCNGIEGKVIIGHDPQRVRMCMRGQKVAEVQRSFGL